MAGRRKKPGPMASSSAPPWVELPLEITTNILERLATDEKLVTAQVCTTWRSVCKDPSMWRKIHIFRDSSRRHIDFESMCRHVVDRSRGQLLDLSISGFGSDSLLNHIAERSSGLRCLSIEIANDITRSGVVEATKGLPLLEELHISGNSDYAGFKALVYCSFPALKSLTISWTRGRRPTIHHISKKLAIMEVHYLRTVGKEVYNQHLMPMFDACTHLKSLNLELGYDLSIDWDVADQVSQQIKAQEADMDGFHGEYKMHYCDSTCVRISFVYSSLSMPSSSQSVND